MKNTIQKIAPLRAWLLLACFLLMMFALAFRAVYLQLWNNHFLQQHGDARALRVIEIPAYRGNIIDRNGQYLAISTPVESIWADPKKLLEEKELLPKLAEILNISHEKLKKEIAQRLHLKFMYLKRHANPEIVSEVKELNISGVSTKKEYKRYYPAAEVTAQLLGFTNIDDQGQEGLELAYNDWLSGYPGSRRIVKDRLNQIIEHLKIIEPARPGKHLQLSIDLRVQYLAYRELVASIKHHQAAGGCLIVLDVQTGEVIAMVSEPSYNPNNRGDLVSHFVTNTAVNNIFEPGSTMKPFSIVAAFESDDFPLDKPISTSPGYLKIGKDTVRDLHDYAKLSLTEIITKSSNVGASKVALSLDRGLFADILTRFGFGQTTGSGFPGELSGTLKPFHSWSTIETATLAFGYGLSVTPLQLVRAYAALATDGSILPISYTKTDQPVHGKQIIKKQTAYQVRQMLKTVVQPGGTGTRAKIPGYHVLGKTGTARKLINGNYVEGHYLSLFVGIAPENQPRFAAIVLIDEPSIHGYYGGLVAAPLFSKVMSNTLRIFNVAPDDYGSSSQSFILRKNLEI